MPNEQNPSSASQPANPAPPQGQPPAAPAAPAEVEAVEKAEYDRLATELAQLKQRNAQLEGYLLTPAEGETPAAPAAPTQPAPAEPAVDWNKIAQTGDPSLFANTLITETVKKIAPIVQQVQQQVQQLPLQTAAAQHENLMLSQRAELEKTPEGKAEVATYLPVMGQLWKKMPGADFLDLLAIAKTRYPRQAAQAPAASGPKIIKLPTGGFHPAGPGGQFSPATEKKSFAEVFAAEVDAKSKELGL